MLYTPYLTRFLRIARALGDVAPLLDATPRHGVGDSHEEHIEAQQHMNGLEGYFLTVYPLLILMAAAMWRPRLYQWAILAFLALNPLPFMVFYGVLLYPWLILTVAPLMFWRRTWPRFVIPATVLINCLAYCVWWGWDVSVTFYLSISMFSAVFSMGVSLIAIIYRRRLADSVATGRPPNEQPAAP